MDTNEVMRQQVCRLIEHGVTQKHIAKRMEVTETWLSRWVTQKRDSAPTVVAMDRLHAYLEEMRVALDQPPTAATREDHAPVHTRRHG